MAVSLGLVVKRIKGKRYVYRQYRVNGRVVTEYIGPLEEMVAVYELYKAGRIQGLNKRMLRQYARILAEELAKKLVNTAKPDRSKAERKEEVKDGLVRRPGFEPGITGLGDPSGIQVQLGKPIVSNQLLVDFRKWLIGESVVGNNKPVSMETALYYYNIVGRGEWPPRKRAHRKAWRKYIEYLYRRGLLGLEKYSAYMKFLEVGTAARKGGRPLIPLERIQEQLMAMRALGYGALGLMLLGGTRLRGVLRLLEKPKEWHSENVRHPHGGYEPRLYCSGIFCRVYLGETHGRKKYHYVYWPGGLEVLEAARAEVSGRGYKEIKDKLTHSGIEIGLFRDFATQRLEQLAHENNIRLDAVNMVVSRELSVTGGHYLDTRNWADRLFSIYAQWLRAQGVIPDGWPGSSQVCS